MLSDECVHFGISEDVGSCICSSLGGVPGPYQRGMGFPKEAAQAISIRPNVWGWRSKMCNSVSWVETECEVSGLSEVSRV